VRPVPASTPIGRFVDSLVVRGRLIPRGESGCDLTLHIYPSRVNRVVVPVLLAAGVVLFLVGALLTGIATFLVGVAMFVGVALLNAAVLWNFRRFEEGERRLLNDWIASVRRALESGNAP
jgi:hypothetical protein